MKFILGLKKYGKRRGLKFKVIKMLTSSVQSGRPMNLATGIISGTRPGLSGSGRHSGTGSFVRNSGMTSGAEFMFLPASEREAVPPKPSCA